MQHWTVDAIDSEGAIKKFKIKVKDVFNMSGRDKVVVHFDDQYLPIGEAQGLLAGFGGTLAPDSSLCPINFDKWKDMPKSYIDTCFEKIIKPRFHFETTEENARRYVKNSISKKWGQSRQKLWNEFYDPLKSRDELIANVPVGIRRDQWTSFVNYRLNPKTMEKIQHAMSKRNIDESQVSPKDAVSRVLGKEHPGRIRCVGMGAVPSQTRLHQSSSSSSSTHHGACSSQCQENYNILRDALKAYMIMKDGRVPDEFARIFSSQTTSNDTVSQPTNTDQQMNVNRSSGGSTHNQVDV